MDHISTLLLGTIGLYSPYPTADNLFGSTPSTSLKYLKTDTALAVDNSSC